MLTAKEHAIDLYMGAIRDGEAQLVTTVFLDSDSEGKTIEFNDNSEQEPPWSEWANSGKF